MTQNSSTIDTTNSNVKKSLNTTDYNTNSSDLPKAAAVVDALKDQYQNQWIFNSLSESWYSYSIETGVWIELKDIEIQSLVQRILDADPATYCNYGAHFVKEILTLLKAYLFENNWNSCDGLLPLQNGVLDLKNKTLLEHSPDYRFTWCLPFSYAPEATCEPIQEWLLETVKDEQIVQLLRAYMNAVVMGRSNLQRFLECVGPGGTGKSTYANLVMALIGTRNTISTNLRTLTQNRFETANLLHKKLVYIPDSEQYNGSASMLKALTGGDQIRFEQKFKQGGKSLCCEGLVLIVANETIRFKDANSGIQRRRITVPFNNRVKSENRRELINISDDKVSGEFAAYLPGLLNWVLEMTKDEVTDLLLNTDKSVPSLASAKADTLLETNPMASWLDDCVVVDSSAKALIGDNKQSADTHLYPSYVEYCGANGYQAVSSKLFSVRLLDLLHSELGLHEVEKKHIRNGNCFTSIRLRTQDDNAPKPFTGVTDSEFENEGSEALRILDMQRREGCEGFEVKLSVEDYAMKF